MERRMKSIKIICKGISVSVPVHSPWKSKPKLPKFDQLTPKSLQVSCCTHNFHSGESTD